MLTTVALPRLYQPAAEREEHETLPSLPFSQAALDAALTEVASA